MTERNERIDAALVTQLRKSMQRNAIMIAALRAIATKRKLDAVAAASMQAVACDALKSVDDI
jgi:hypothetical protein